MGLIVSHIYLLTIAGGLCLLYASMRLFLPWFFDTPLRGAFSLRSIAVILALYTAVLAAVFNITDVELGNRILHGVGGGFTAFMACFLAARDSGLRVRRRQFVLMSLFIITALGVANELAELALSQFVEFDFAPTINDTGLDLLSNTVGMVVAAFVFAPWYRRVSATDMRTPSMQRVEVR